ncbi:MAG TPA: hypothetical protein ENI80_03475 [Acidiferrobacteraceae bacterium]|nr:hypothetical protein [Acidiferrobacteraceae bacterium]
MPDVPKQYTNWLGWGVFALAILYAIDVHHRHEFDQAKLALLTTRQSEDARQSAMIAKHLLVQASCKNLSSAVIEITFNDGSKVLCARGLTGIAPGSM